jgi:hypothetical protein
VLDGPLDCQGEGSLRQSSTNDFERADIDQRFALGLKRMEMRWCVLTPEHLDHDSEELADGGRPVISASVCESICRRS